MCFEGGMMQLAQREAVRRTRLSFRICIMLATLRHAVAHPHDIPARATQADLPHELTCSLWDSVLWPSGVQWRLMSTKVRATLSPSPGSLDEMDDSISATSRIRRW
jgi:hypothetical protein